MKNILLFLMLAAALWACTANQKINTLTTAEKEAGWELLFDGKTTNGWRGYNKDHFPKTGWEVENGMLIITKPTPGQEQEAGDIITTKSFDNFELSLEFALTDTANSGIFYLVQEIAGKPVYYHAPEYQILDDETYISMYGDMSKHLTGENYDLHERQTNTLKPTGEWNLARIVVQQPHVEHWLNGTKLVEYELGSTEWKALVANSKFSKYPLYGKATSGPIGLQDHGHTIKFKNIKIRPMGK